MQNTATYMKFGGKFEQRNLKNFKAVFGKHFGNLRSILLKMFRNSK